GGLIRADETVVCLYGHGRSGGGVDGFSVLHVAEQLHLLLSVQPKFDLGDLDHEVLNRVLHIALRLAREGREGKPVGTLFVLGDHETVARYCSQIVMNPFKGYHDEDRNILDPSLEETIKEFSSIDGAFVVRADGMILTAGACLKTDPAYVDLPSGLGTRHAAGMAITAVSEAVSIVISESTGTVTLFKGGKKVVALEKEPG
ncbi:MAG: diadenylate cyclase, partial [Phycisphaerales bacterium]